MTLITLQEIKCTQFAYNSEVNYKRHGAPPIDQSYDLLCCKFHDKTWVMYNSPIGGLGSWKATVLPVHQILSYPT